jgi:hypothetical protein
MYYMANESKREIKAFSRESQGGKSKCMVTN